MALIAILETSLLLVTIAICVTRPRHRLVLPTQPEPTPTAIAVEEPNVVELPAVLRMRRLGRSEMTEETPTTARIAPPNDEGAALQVVWVGETMLADLEPTDLVTVRAWSQGRLAYAMGETRRDYGCWWPQDKDIVGWEIYAVTASGRILHLQGEPGTAIDSELTRLDARMRSARLADAA